VTERSQIDILKGALLLEHKGRALYSSVAETTQVQPVKELFSTLVEEENKHIDFLSRQYSLVAEGGAFDLKGLPESSPAANHAFAGGIADKISGAGYEAAVISAAMEFEKNAVNYYSKQAAASTDEGEKGLYTWLAKWEASHLQMLADIDRELRDRIWNDNRFWPLD
jgi:rubrerythrin